MAYAALCFDRDDADTAALRQRERDRHFAYVESILHRLLVAGPLGLPGAEATPGGPHGASLFLYDVSTEAEARRLLEADPYYQAGIYGRVELRPFIPAAGTWIGGAIWRR